MSEIPEFPEDPPFVDPLLAGVLAEPVDDEAPKGSVDDEAGE